MFSSEATQETTDHTIRVVVTAGGSVAFVNGNFQFDIDGGGGGAWVEVHILNHTDKSISAHCAIKTKDSHHMRVSKGKSKKMSLKMQPGFNRPRTIVVNGKKSAMLFG